MGRDRDGVGIAHTRTLRLAGNAVFILKDYENLAKLIKVKARTNLLIQLLPLGLGKVWSQPLDGLNEAIGHRTFFGLLRRDQSKTWSRLMCDQPKSSTWIFADITVSKCSQNCNTNSG